VTVSPWGHYIHASSDRTTGRPVTSKAVPVTVTYDGTVAGQYRADLLVEQALLGSSLLENK
jgi:hypothetical protein